jgi:hypothetical protein
MDVLSIQNDSADTTSVLQKDSKTASSFATFFQAASDSSSAASGSSSSSDASGDDAVEEFMRYAKETPAQRMFDSWLSSQNITMAQYNAMTPAEQQKLVTEFETQMKTRLHNEMNGSLAMTSVP